MEAMRVIRLPGSVLPAELAYSALVTAFLAYLGIRGKWVGPLLWPAVALHAVLTLFLARSWLAKRRTDRRNNKVPDRS